MLATISMLKLAEQSVRDQYPEDFTRFRFGLVNPTDHVFTSDQSPAEGIDFILENKYQKEVESSILSTVKLAVEQDSVLCTLWGLKSVTWDAIPVMVHGETMDWTRAKFGWDVSRTIQALRKIQELAGREPHYCTSMPAENFKCAVEEHISTLQSERRGFLRWLRWT